MARLEDRPAGGDACDDVAVYAGLNARTVLLLQDVLCGRFVAFLVIQSLRGLHLYMAFSSPPAWKKTSDPTS